MDGLFRCEEEERQRERRQTLWLDGQFTLCQMFDDCSKQVRFEGTLDSDGVFSSGTLLAKTYDDSRMIVKGVKFNGFPVLYASSEFVTDKASHCLRIFSSTLLCLTRCLRQYTQISIC